MRERRRSILELNPQAIQKIELILYVRSDSHAVHVDAAVSEAKVHNYVHIVFFFNLNGWPTRVFLPTIKRK